MRGTSRITTNSSKRWRSWRSRQLVTESSKLEAGSWKLETGNWKLKKMARVPQCTVCEIHAESVFKIDGMDCRDEVTILERRLTNLPGIEDLSADVVGQRLRVS